MKKHLELKKNAWTLLPYLYFIGLAAFWFYMDISQVQNFSYAALGIIIILISQVIIQNKIFGVSLGIVGTTLNVLFFLAVLSEFNDFKVVSESAIQLITVGTILSLSGLAMGVILTTTNLKKLKR